MDTRAKREEDKAARRAAKSELLLANFMTVNELSEELGIAVETIYKWNCRGGDAAPPRVRLGRAVLYPRAEVEKWLLSKVVAA